MWIQSQPDLQNEFQYSHSVSVQYRNSVLKNQKRKKKQEKKEKEKEKGEKILYNHKKWNKSWYVVEVLYTGWRCATVIGLIQS